ncbi:poly-gamma-glutamate synthesis protein (capsule biosynthesis protein) [Limimonas halophila]|uniref:Poly-gamma-glutamate synthesis protein (Capsule biosynthesis protein) n=1 Tax=Limimonas halophila TaxID=1082479 RepID=A0A1G7Q1E8_9PROT|nr:CapA family protein [Limimonas halophila]SDF92392.1 poly-gamma-glutamate synthesis protein (capsule biosynthesis protein) [Limimonas halophila]
MPETAPATITLALCGDVMTGRGIDQILPYPAPPHRHEPVVTDARAYVDLAEAANGPVPKPVDWRYVWGEALADLERVQPAVRIANLETAVTRSEDAAPKGITYRMNPANAPVLTAFGLDVATLANNHVLDWGERGLTDTLDTLDAAGIARCGSGRDSAAAAVPAVVPRADGGRVLVFACAHGSSGVPAHWAARPDRPGVNRLPDLSDTSADALCRHIAAWRRPGDVVVVTVHWGGNWGFDVPADQRTFARALIARGGVSVVHGHSSHHAKAVERHRDGLILYGSGDFLTDYEGIATPGSYRDDLVLLVLPEIAVADGSVRACTLVPFQLRRMQLARPSAADRRWLADTLARESTPFDTAVTLTATGSMTVTAC